MTECFRIYDSNGKPQSTLKPRNQVHADGDWHRAVETWILNSKNELLIQKRASGKDSFPDKWDASCAGHIDGDEESINTAIRELKEELGLEINASELQYLFETRETNVTNNGRFIDNEIKDIYLLEQDIDINDLNLQAEEVSTVRFIHFQDLEKMIQENSGDFVPHKNTYAGLFAFIRQHA
ncbi:NUDIX domain-containing protein [Candidatus Peregrinibacteria bacterium]|nr:NUDIX domain-containing protein [Candidatus Peregrinibacteria bacterium]